MGSTRGLAVAESCDHPHASRDKRGSRFLNLDYCLSKVVAVRTGEHASGSTLAWGFGNDPAHHVSLPPCCLPPRPSDQLANRKPKDRKPVSAIHTELPSSFISPPNYLQASIIYYIILLFPKGSAYWLYIKFQYIIIILFLFIPVCCSMSF